MTTRAPAVLIILKLKKPAEGKKILYIQNSSNTLVKVMIRPMYKGDNFEGDSPNEDDVKT